MKNKIVNNKIFENLLIAIIIMSYFIGINALYNNLEMKNILVFLKVASIVFIVIDIILIEIAYRRESKKIAINSIEMLILAGHTLSVAHIVTAKKFEFENYILVSSYMFSIYYVLKAICLYTKDRRDYLNSLSDIKEIVANTPTKKEATKKSE